MEKNIILKADSFKYPNKHERIEIYKKIPKIKILDIKYESAFLEIIKNREFEKSISKEEIY